MQPGQLVGVTSFIGREDLTREIARAAYERGASFVDVIYLDQLLKRARLLYGDPETFSYIPPWMVDRLRHLSDEHAARITLVGPQAPRALDDVPADRSGIDLLPFLPEVGRDREPPDDELVCHSRPDDGLGDARLPGRGAGPGLRPPLGGDRTRLPSRRGRSRGRLGDADADAQRGAASLSDRRFDAIHLHGPGTDLTVGLFRSAIWEAAEFKTVDGVVHFPNLPSEEIFTTPDPLRVDGHVAATMPLELYGTIIRGLRVEFAGGRATRIDADENAETLRAAVAKDEGAARLGELALVDGSGRIGPLRTVFFDTLLDENAASHIALGNGFTYQVADEAEKQRVNESEIHVDFMIGSPELDVDGITEAGEHVPVLRQGAWQI